MSDEEHESDYEDAEDEMFGHSFRPSYVVIAIDNHPMMFQKNADGVMRFRSCLEACFNLANALLFMKDKRAWSPFAVIITGQSTPLIAFDNNVLESIKLLEEKSALSDNDLMNEFQREGPLDLANFFLTCKKILHEKSTCHKRTLLYLSNDEEPASDKNAKFTAFNEMRNISSSQIKFEIIPTVESFNYKLFYNELYKVIGTENREDICTDTDGLTQKLKSSILLKTNERKVNFYPFRGDSDKFIKCCRINIFTNVLLNNISLTTKGEKIRSNPSEDSPTHYTIKFIGNAKGDGVKFDDMEKKSLEDSTLPKGYTLMYIADRQVPLGHIFNKPVLIKEHAEEEIHFFSKFWERCVATNKVLVCISKIRQPDRIKYCELVPVLVNETQMFIEKRLPYANEISLPLKKVYPEEEVDSGRKQAVKNLVDTLTFDFDLKMIPDAMLMKKKAYVKAKLLNEPMEEVEDVTFNPQQLDAVLEDVVKDIESKFVLGEAQSKKRKAPTNSGTRKKKSNQP